MASEHQSIAHISKQCYHIPPKHRPLTNSNKSKIQAMDMKFLRSTIGNTGKEQLKIKVLQDGLVFKMCKKSQKRDDYNGLTM
jgi:hypothetical protein